MEKLGSFEHILAPSITILSNPCFKVYVCFLPSNVISKIINIDLGRQSRKNVLKVWKNYSL